MKTSAIILKDLQGFLNERDIKSFTKTYPPLNYRNEKIVLMIGRFDYFIADGWINYVFAPNTHKPVVSLADPQYREKFLKFIKLSH